MQVYQSAAVVTGVQAPGGARRVRFVRLWVRDGRDWKIAIHHGTTIAQAQANATPVGSSRTRSGRARAPTSSSGGTTARRSPTGAPTARSLSSSGCWSASAGRTGVPVVHRRPLPVGASPERHVSIHGGDVRMNPISGTFRLPTPGRRHP